MSVTTKLEVEYSQFKKGMAEAQASVKTLDAELKLSEAQFKATGDAEKYAADQAALLQQKLNAQKDAAKNAEQMLLNLYKRGVAPTSTEYQRMAQKMLNAQAAVASTQAELNKLNTKQQEAAGSAKTLTDEVGKIGKNVSLQNISDGISKITGGMERAYRTAVRFGRTVMRSMMDATGWADDVMTRAIEYGTDVETIQKMDRVAAFIDTDVDTIIRAKDQMSKNQKNLAELLGISTDGRNVDDVFWEAGEAIMNLGEGMDKSDYAMKIFGKSWRELLPLFTAGREEYESLMESQDVLSAEQVETLAKADDEIQKVQNEIQNLKNQFWAEHSGTVIELLEWVVNNKEAVIAALTAIGAAFAALKVAEVALNLTKIIKGFQDLKLFTGAKTAAEAANTVANATGTGGTATPLTAKMMNGIGAMVVIDYDPLKSLEYQQQYGQSGWAKYMDEMMGTNMYEMVEDWKNNGPKGAGASRSFAGEGIEVPVKPVPEEGSAEEIAAEIGAVTVPVKLSVVGVGMGAFGGGGSGLDPLRQAFFGQLNGFANGIPFVNHTQLAWLHRGERVLTASQNRSYTYNSHNYFGNVNLNNGMEIDALTERIDRQNRRQRAAYGA